MTSKRQRRSTRLHGYDYEQAGAYFVTLCAQDRECLFGEVVDGAMRLGGAGEMIHSAWEALPAHYPSVDLDAFVVMPNHLHGIVVLDGTSGLALGDLIQRFKTLTTHRYIEKVREGAWPAFRRRVWQRNYYDHVIRDGPSLQRIREYVHDNPARWATDPENPSCV